MPPKVVLLSRRKLHNGHDIQRIAPHQNHVGGFHRHIGTGSNGDAHISLCKRRGIVHTVLGTASAALGAIRAFLMPAEVRSETTKFHSRSCPRLSIVILLTARARDQAVWRFA